MSADSPSGSLALRPGALGRTLRIIAGAVLLYVLVGFLHDAPALLQPLPGWRVPGGAWWVIAAFCWMLLPDSLYQGPGLRLGTRSQYIVGGMAIAAGVCDWLAFGSFWAAPLAWLVLALLVLVLGYTGVSFLLAGAMAAPG